MILLNEKETFTLSFVQIFAYIAAGLTYVTSIGVGAQSTSGGHDIFCLKNVYKN